MAASFYLCLTALELISKVKQIGSVSSQRLTQVVFRRCSQTWGFHVPALQRVAGKETSLESANNELFFFFSLKLLFLWSLIAVVVVVYLWSLLSFTVRWKAYQLRVVKRKPKYSQPIDQSEGQFLREPIRIQRSRLQAWENAIDEVEIDCNFLHLRG